MSKILIGTIAGSVAAVSIATAILIGVIVKTTDRKPVITRQTTIEETERTVRTRNTETEPEETETTTKETEPSKKITEDSIYINMDGMTADEIVNNIFKTTRVKVGVTKEEYAERFVFKSKNGRTNSPVDNFYWQFIETGKNRIMMLDLAMPRDKETNAVTGFNQNSFVELQMTLEGPDFAKEVFEKIIERFKDEGYEVEDDISPKEKFHGRVVTFRGHGVAFRISRLSDGDAKKQTYDIKIPLRGE